MDYSVTETIIEQAKSGDKDSMLFLIESYKFMLYNHLRICKEAELWHYSRKHKPPRSQWIWNPS